MDKKRRVQNESTKGDPVIARMPKACADELTAVEFMEELRWGKHPACPTCGEENVYKMTSRSGGRVAGFRWRCRGCNALYSVRKGTVMEDSAIPFRHWCFAFWRAAASKKGVSALEIHRTTGISYKSALFLMNRKCGRQDSNLQGLRAPTHRCPTASKAAAFTDFATPAWWVGSYQPAVVLGCD